MLIKVDPEKSVQENMVNLANTGSSVQFTPTELTFGDPVSDVVENDPRNTKVICFASETARFQGSVEVRYRRNTLEQNNISAGTVVPTNTGDNIFTLKQKIIDHLNLKADQILFSNIVGNLSYREQELVQIEPIDKSLLYAPGEFEITILNVDFGPLDNYTSDVLDGFDRTIEALSSLILSVLNGFDQMPAESNVVKLRGSDYNGVAGTTTEKTDCYLYAQGLRGETQFTWGTLPTTWAEWTTWYQNPKNTISLTVTRTEVSLAGKSFVPIADASVKNTTSMSVEIQYKTNSGGSFSAWEPLNGQTLTDKQVVSFKITLNGTGPEFLYVRTGFKILS